MTARKWLKFNAFSTEAPPWWGPIVLLPFALVLSVAVDIVALEMGWGQWWLN